MTTYKDLCNLVSELNQPDLIYKFMALSNHNALWNSRKGAAFGFASIANLAVCAGPCRRDVLYCVGPFLVSIAHWSACWIVVRTAL
jgi:hypothetical protein